MNDIYILIFEYNIDNKHLYSNYINLLKRKKYNFIFCLITHIKNIQINEFDLIYYSKDKNRFIKIIKKLPFPYYKYVIHIPYLTKIDFDKIINSNFDNIYVSNDTNNSLCRIIPYNMISTLDNTYFTNKYTDIIDIINSNIKYDFFYFNYDHKIIILNNFYDFKISVIMTTFNSENTIHFSIKSILNQTYKNISLVIVDDASTDSTFDILKSYKQKHNNIRLIKCSVNKGCYYSKNIALNHISKDTKYIFFQDSDDFSYSSRIEKQVNFMEKNNLIMTNCLTYKDSLQIPLISTCIEISVFKKLGYFDNKRFGEDEHLYYRFFNTYHNDFDYNMSLSYNKNNSLFKTTNYYANLNSILYTVIGNQNSLTKIYPNRQPLSNKFKLKYTSNKINCYIPFIQKQKIEDIKYAYVSESLSHLKTRFLQKFNLLQRKSSNHKCLFFGLYTQNDINIFNNQKEKYIMWGGTDLDQRFDNRKDNLNRILKNDIRKHYSISDCISNRLKDLGISYERVDLDLTDMNHFNRIILGGDSIFVYNGFKKGNEYIYGKQIYEKLSNYKFIFSNELQIDNSKMYDIYKKCFIGLRLTKYDGNANSVLEMKHMNLPVICNSSYDNCLNWKNIQDIKNHINNNFPKILIIFDKDLTIVDGSFVWLTNFIKLIKSYNHYTQIHLFCKKFVKIDDVTHVNSYNENQYNHIFFRIIDNITFKNFNNVSLIIHKFEFENLFYYKKFKNLIVQSKLIKNELILNNFFQEIHILPPLISQILNKNKQDNQITFVYSGTLKQDYKSLEMIKLFKELLKNYKFRCIIIYGKIKKDRDDNYYKKLLEEVNNSEEIIFKNNLDELEIKKIINSSDYGIVIHSINTDYKQQSTKLIEYLSLGCKPIVYFTSLNVEYSDIYFRSINELKEIIKKILDDSDGETTINSSKLGNHLIKNNYHIFNNCNKVIMTSNLLKRCVKKVVTNNYENLFNNNEVIYVKDNYDNISKLIFDIYNNHKIENIKKLYEFKDLIITNFDLILFDFSIKKKKYVFNYEIDKKYLSKINVIDEYILQKDKESYLEIPILLKSKFNYYVKFSINTLSKDNIFFLSITDYKGVLKDVNRNLYYLNKNSSEIKMILNVRVNNYYLFKIRGSDKSKSDIRFTINELKIEEIIDVNKICEKVCIINLDGYEQRYRNIKKRFENYGIVCSRSCGVNGYKDINVKNQYKNYINSSFSKKEKLLGRKLIVSEGGFGYLHSMKNIFKDAILKGYNYIMICDDDIGLMNNFVERFNNIPLRFRLLMLGSSQWAWDNIDILDNYYIPNDNSNGSFCNIYHFNTFELIYNNILKFACPFDDDIMKDNFKLGGCYVMYPNLVIADLDYSLIRETNNSRTYDRFKWDKLNYNFNIEYKESEYKTIKNFDELHDIKFVIGVITYNRMSYFEECFLSILDNLSDDINYMLVIAEGNHSTSVINFLNNLDYSKNVSVTYIKNYEHYIYNQTNSIFKLVENIDYNFGFIMNDDILVKKLNWDKRYYNISKKYKYDHLVFFDVKFKTIDHTIKNNDLQSYCKAINCQGALFTFTKNLLNKVGYFDEENFKIRGHSHIDFTIRCCKNGFNKLNELYDIINSNKYLELKIENYVSSFNYLPFYLREKYKVDIYELDKRNKLLK
jgi:glycosyltransferase involved in cell wall biosynthesis